MAVTRRGGAFALAVALVLSAGGACTSKSGTNVVPPQQMFDGAVYQECTSVCVRPTDCAKTFNDDGICPPGFLCATRFSCNPD